MDDPRLRKTMRSLVRLGSLVPFPSTLASGSWPSARALRGNLATMETDLVGSARAVADAASAHDYAARQRAAARHRKAFARWLRFRQSDRSAQRSCPHLAKPFKAGHERER
jgi:hypothetical protein